jgi:hypothetical protein
VERGDGARQNAVRIPGQAQCRAEQNLEHARREAKTLCQGWKVEDTSQAALTQRIQADTKLYGDLIHKKEIKLE